MWFSPWIESLRSRADAWRRGSWWGIRRADDQHIACRCRRAVMLNTSSLSASPPAAIRRFLRDQSDDLSQLSHICLSLLLSVISFIISASPHDVITHSRHSASRWTLTSRTVQYTCSVTSGHHPHTQWAASDTRALNTTCCVLWYRTGTALLELHGI